MLRPYLFIVFVALMPLGSPAQHAELDSLVTAFLTYDRYDTRGTLYKSYQKLDRASFAVRARGDAEKTKHTKGPGRVPLLVLIGEVYWDRHSYDTAKVFFDKALHVAIAENKVYVAVNAYATIASIFKEENMFVEAMEYIYKAIALSESVKSGRDMGLAGTYAEAANICYRAGNYALAAEEIERSLHYFRQYGPHTFTVYDSADLMISYSTKAQSLMFLNEDNKALASFDTVEHFASALKSDFWVCLINGYRSEIYSRRGETDKAIRSGLMGFRGMVKYQEWRHAIISAIRLANIYAEFEEWQKARYYMDTTNVLIAAHGLTRRPYGQAEYYWETVALLAAHDHNTALAYEALKMHKVLRDSSDAERQAINLAKIKSAFEVQQKQTEIELLTAESKLNAQQLAKRNAIAIATSVGLLLLGAWMLTLYRSMQRKKNDNLLLAQQNDEINAINEELRAYADTLAQQREEIVVQKDEIAVQNEKLQAAMNDLKVMQAQLLQAEKMASLGQMTAGIAHEINNPLNFISGGVSSLKMLVNDLVKVTKPNGNGQLLKNSTGAVPEEISAQQLEQDIQVLLDSIGNGVKRTTKIISGLLTFSSPQSEEYIDVNVHDSLDTALVLQEANLSGNKIVVETNFDKALPPVKASPVQLGQVFTNIIDNAIYAMSSQATPRKILITTALKNNKVVVSIRDTGPGISKQDQSKIIEPFFTTKPVGKGTGLGLSISYGIISKLGGQLTFNTQGGKGTEFIIALEPSGTNKH